MAAARSIAIVLLALGAAGGVCSSAPQDGATSLSGVVVDGASGRPVANAKVRLGRASVESDAAGQFAFQMIPAGRLALRAEKPGTFGGGYGQLTPFDSPLPGIDFSQEQKVAGVQLRLWKGGVISGTIRDRGGEPVAGAAVRALKCLAGQRRRVFMSAATVRSDDRGNYRLFGLEPGEYTVTARREEDDPFARTAFIPSAASASGAAVLMADAGRELSGVDLDWPTVRTTTVSGTIRNLAPGSVAQVRLVAANADEPALVSGDLDGLATASDALGGFSLANVPPGAYELRVVSFPKGIGGLQGAGAFYSSGGLSTRIDEPTLWGSVPLVVGDGGERRAGIVIDVRPAARIDGRVEFDASSPGEARVPARIPILVEEADADDPGTRPLLATSTDGQFQTTGLPPGRYWCRPSVSMMEWSLEAANVGGRDVSDGVALSGEDVHGLTLTLTDRPAEIAGAVTDQFGRPRSDVSVYVFPVEERLRVRTSWLLRMAETTTVLRGEYRVTGLAPGQYFVAARAGGAGLDWAEPGSLTALVADAHRVRLEVHSRQVVNLIVPGAGDAHGPRR